MKKISPPTNERLSVEQQQQQQQQQEPSHPAPLVDIDIKPVLTDVPKPKVFAYDLKKMKSFKQLRKKYKQKNELEVFLCDMKIVMAYFDTKEFQLDRELLVHVSNIAECFFIYGTKTERDDNKTFAINELMLPYFRNDRDILDVMRVSVWSRVKKSNYMKRLAKRISNWFFLN